MSFLLTPILSQENEVKGKERRQLELAREHPSASGHEPAEDVEPYVVLMAHIRFSNDNKQFVLKTRDIDPFVNIKKPLLRQLNSLGHCRGEGRMELLYNGSPIVSFYFFSSSSFRFIDFSLG